MKTLYKELGVECDVHKDDGFCWVEESVTLSMHDYVSKAISILRHRGWVIGKVKDICPYCSKGITKFISEKLLQYKKT